MNVLSKTVVTLPNGLTTADMIPVLVTATRLMPHVYSYLLYREQTAYVLELMTSQTTSYNTIDIDDVITETITHIERDRKKPTKTVVGYKQPPLQLMIQLYEPLVQSLARKMRRHWRHLELDDLLQMARLSICTLYKAGYYLHRRLIERCFTNDVLQSIRHERNAPPITSLNNIVAGKDGNDCELGDLIRDEALITHLQDEEDNDIRRKVTDAMRSFVIQEVGERQYDLLLSEYTSNCTTTRTQKLVYRLKDKVKSLEIDSTTWRNYNG